MTGSGAWPEIDETMFSDRAEALERKLLALTGAKEKWSGHEAALFNGEHVWSGQGAGRAGSKVADHSTAMSAHEQQLRDAINWCDEAAKKVSGAKDTISDNVAAAQSEIQRLQNEAALLEQDPTSAIHSLVNEEYFQNFNTVNELAMSIGGKPGLPQAPFGDADDADLAEDSSKGTGQGEPVVLTNWSSRGAKANQPETPVEMAPVNQATTSGWSQQGTHTKSPIGVANPSTTTPAAWTSQGQKATAPERGATPPAGGGVQGPAGTKPLSPAASQYPSLPSPSVAAPAPSPTGSGGSGGAPSLAGGISPTSGTSIGSTGSSSSGLSGGSSGSDAPSGPMSDGSPAAGDRPSVDPSNGASGPSSGAGGQPPIQSPPIADRLSNIGPAMQPASAPMAAPAAPTEVAPPAAPAPSNPTTSTAAHAPVAPVSPPATGGGVPMAGGPAMPPPPMPLGPPPTPSAAAPVVPTSAVPPPVAAPTSSAGSVVGAPAPVPVSAARAERDAIAGSMRRQSAGDPVQVARRVAAALNAVESMDFGFFWATGVTKDGTILVANSYGIGYIPDGVKLPDGVRMVSADESIPIDERAKWATFPMLALHGWAQHHDVPLRAVVATAEQFDGFDPGAARVILTPDDIPERGDMAGRSRLEVIAPGAARQLASVDDTRLGDLLPPAPADTTPPADNSLMLWFEVMKPLMSTSAERGAAHLEAMVSYANHAQELALHRAQTATDAATQRAAIADWVYWQHVSVMSNDAIVIRQ
ncbi:hypothetical protein A5778_19995 [Mycolicibacterium monacense]|nr:hypothetical protein A5778_19995 [Mycolicibacterium monacense]